MKIVKKQKMAKNRNAEPKFANPYGRFKSQKGLKMTKKDRNYFSKFVTKKIYNSIKTLRTQFQNLERFAKDASWE